MFQKVNNIAILYTLAISIFVFFSLFNLKYHPILEPDEGLNILLAKDLSNTGKYTIITVPGFKEFMHVMYGTGPFLIIQLAGIFKITGTSILTARLLIFLYSFGLYYLLWYYTKKYLSNKSALLVLYLYPLTFFYGFRSLQLTFMGEIPMLFFVLLGYIKINKNSSINYFLGYLFFSLACLIKIQALYLVLPLSILYFSFNNKRIKIIDFIYSLIGFLIPLFIIFLWQIRTTDIHQTVMRLSELLVHGNSKDILSLITFIRIVELPIILVIPMLGIIIFMTSKTFRNSLKKLDKSVVILLFLIPINIVIYLNGIHIIRYLLPVLIINIPFSAYIITEVVKDSKQKIYILAAFISIMICINLYKLSIKETYIYEMSEYINLNLKVEDTIESNFWNIIPITNVKYTQNLKTFYWFNNKIGKDYGKLTFNDTVKEVNSDYLLINRRIHNKVNKRYLEITKDRVLLKKYGPFELYKL